jgi:hypothetical protein
MVPTTIGIGIGVVFDGQGGGGGGSVPANALRDRAGNLILTRSGDYILPRT